MSNICTSNITITGPDANKIYEKIKDANELFNLFIPSPPQFKDWEFDERGTKAWYSLTFDEGHVGEVVVDKIPVSQAELKAFVDQIKEATFIVHSPTDTTYLPADYWQQRWMQLNWGRDRETYPTNIYFDENLGLLEFSCNTRYSPPAFFLQYLSENYDVKISNAWEAEVSVGKDHYENGEETKEARYNFDVVEPEEQALVYNKEWLEMTDEERRQIINDLYDNDHERYVRQYKAEVVTFMQENGLFHYDKFAPVRKAATYYVKSAKGGAYHIGPNGKSVICLVTDSKRIGKDVFELEIRTLFGDNLGKFTVGGPNDQSELLTHVQ